MSGPASVLTCASVARCSCYTVDTHITHHISHTPATPATHTPPPLPPLSADADVYLLDDPLSAVDAHVGRQLLDECITGLLAGKTRVLVTHQLQVLPSADLVMVMVEGRVTHRGTHQVGGWALLHLHLRRGG